VINKGNVRQYTLEGTLAAGPPHLGRLQALSLDILWVMAVRPIGVKNRKAPLGSCYSIRDYTAVNPELGTLADFKTLGDDAHACGAEDRRATAFLPSVQGALGDSHVGLRETLEAVTEPLRKLVGNAATTSAGTAWSRSRGRGALRRPSSGPARGWRGRPPSTSGAWS
jgi:hypothetical protein